MEHNDIQRTALRLIRRHRYAAESYANAQMWQYITADDPQGASIWQAVAHEIRKRQTGKHLKLIVNKSRL